MNKVKLESILLIPSRNGLCKAKALRGNGAKMVSMGNVFAHSRINVDSIQMERVPLEENEKINFSIINNDLLFARRSLTFDGAGKCSIVKNCSDTTVFESSMIRLRIDTTKAIPDYIFYYFNSIHGINNIRTIVEQVAVAGIRGSDLVKLEVPCPDIPTQKKIASVLQDFDNKIELNNKINENLQQQAQALFKSWFVDFEPWGGVMPEDWRIGTFTEIASIVMGQSPEGKSLNENKEGEVFYQGRTDFGWRFPSRRVYTTSPKRFAKSGDILLSVRAPVGDMNIAIEDCSIGRGVAAISSKYKNFLFYLMRVILQKKIESFDSQGTVFGCINRKDLENLDTLIPDENAMHKFNERIESMEIKIHNNFLENQRLSQLRDTLLPKLMSGELDVSSIDL